MINNNIKQSMFVEMKRLKGVTPHAFMVGAIRAAAVAAERRAMFVADAAASKAEIMKSGHGYSAAKVDSYIQARARGTVVSKPKAKSWRS